jgi:hypothetical protein
MTDEVERVFTPDERPVLDFRLSPEEAEALRRELVSRGAFVAALQLTIADDEEDLLRLLAHAAHLPLSFAGNWDAVGECLLDVEAFGESKGFVVLLAGSMTPGFDKLAEAIVAAGPHWAEAGRFTRLVLT